VSFIATIEEKNLMPMKPEKLAQVRQKLHGAFRRMNDSSRAPQLREAAHQTWEALRQVIIQHNYHLTKMKSRSPKAEE
jgi:hypothetical protein